MHIINIFALLVYTKGIVSKPVSQILTDGDLQNYSDASFPTESEEGFPIATTNTDPINDFLANNEPEVGSFISISPQNALTAQTIPLPECNSDTHLSEALDENVHKRTLDHKSHVKRQRCRTERPPTIERSATKNPNQPSVEHRRRPGEDEQVITKPATEPCKGLERDKHLTCGGWCLVSFAS